MSAAFNTMAGAMYEDIVEPFLLCGMKQSDLRQSIIMKILSMLIGCVCVALTLAVDKTDSIFQARETLGLPVCQKVDIVGGSGIESS